MKKNQSNLKFLMESNRLLVFYLVSDLYHDDNTSVEMIVYPVSQKSQRFGLYYHMGSSAASWIRGDPTLSDGEINIGTSSFYVDTSGDVYFRGEYVYYIIYKTK